MRVGENEREKERSAAGIDWCLLGSSARDRSVLSLSHPRSRSRRDYDDDDDTLPRHDLARRVRSMLHELGRRERRRERMRDLLFVSYLATGMSLATRSSLARSLTTSFARSRAHAWKRAASRRSLLFPSPLSIPLGPSFALCLSPRRSPFCRLFSCPLFLSLSFATLSPYNRTPPFARFSLFLLSSPRETRHIFSYTSASSPCKLEFRRGSPGILVLPPLPPLTPSRRKRLVCHKRQLDRVDRPRFNSLPLPLLLLPSVPGQSRVP